MKAQVDHKSAKLSSDWGYQYAVRLFGQEAIDSLPVLKSGPNKGKPAGYVCWLKTRTAGYCSYVYGGAPAGMVVRAWVGQGQFTPEDNALSGMVFGRIQPMCLSRCYLGEEGRARHGRARER